MRVHRTFLAAVAATTLVTASALAGSGAALAAEGDPADVVTPAATESADPAGTAAAAATADEVEAPRAPDRMPQSAQVFGTLKASPAGPYTNGQTVTLSYTGFPANAQIVASTCVGGITLGGPGDCAPLNGSGSAVTAADGSGKGSVKIKVIAGTLGASDEPAHKCGNGADEKCVFSVTDFSGNGPKTIAVTYKTASSGSTSGTTSGTGSSSGKNSGSSGSSGTTGTSGTSGTGGTSGTAAATTSSDPALAATGNETGRLAGLGVALLVLGGVMAVGFGRRFSTDGSDGTA